MIDAHGQTRSCPMIGEVAGIHPMTQVAMRLLFVAVSVCFLCLGCEKKPQPTAKAVYLVPIGSDLSLNIGGLQSYYKEHYGLELKTLPSMAIDDSVLDPSRDQIVAERVIDAIQNRYSEARDPENVLIGLTAKDMYIQQRPDWAWAFSYRGNGRLAVISNARMTPSNYGLPPNQPLLETRERKFVTKNIGILYYGKSPSEDPKSVLYGKVGGLDDLDGMGEEF
jgi:predicted Zn-dependent protease